MKKVMAFVAALMALPLMAAAQDFKEADNYFKEGKYQQALAAYEELAKNGKETDTRYRSIYRSAECEALLQRHAAAAQRLSELKTFPDSRWKARLLLLRAETGRLFLERHGWTLPQDAQDGTDDVTKKTAAQWHAAIAEDFKALYPLRKRLAAVAMEEEAYFIDIRNADLSRSPTLWDFIVTRWTEYLTTAPEGTESKPPAESFLAPAYGASYASATSRLSAVAALLEETASMPSKGRETAIELLKIERLTLPFRHGDMTLPFISENKARETAITQLKAWQKSFQTRQGQAKAAYEAAMLAYTMQKEAETITLCKFAERTNPKSQDAQQCASVRASITAPSIELAARFAPPPGTGSISIKARNLPALHFRIYKTTKEEIQQLQSKLDNYNLSIPNALRGQRDEMLIQFLSRKPDHAWRVKVNYPAPYKEASPAIEVPKLDIGQYVVTVCGDQAFKPGVSQISFAVLNITELILAGDTGVAGKEDDFIFNPEAPTARNTGIFHFYAMNGKSGRPAADAALSLYKRNEQVPSSLLRTDERGMASLSADIPLDSPSAHIYEEIDLLAASGKSIAYLPGPLYAHYSVPAPVQIFVETDRPIYRPGQEVRFKVTALRRVPQGWTVYGSSETVRVTVFDANRKEVCNPLLRLNNMGTGSGSCQLPTGRMLGRYSAETTVHAYGTHFSASAGFGVEEYKRPEFEVKLDEAKDAFKYGETAKVTGKAAYYFGGAVPGATVNWTVRRERYIPFFAWWWRGIYGVSARTEVASGQAKTDDNGTFSVSFVPQPDDPANMDFPSVYTLEANARDAGGRTITESRSYRAGSKAYLFDITPPAGFLSAGKPQEVKARLLTLNDAPASGKGTWELHTLEHMPPYATGEQVLNADNLGTLEQQWRWVKNTHRAQGGTVDFTTDAPASIRLSPLPEGVFRLTLKAADPWGGACESSIIIVAVNENGKIALDLPPVALPEHASYKPGETARFLIGAGALKGVKYAEVRSGEFLLERRMIDESGLSIIEVPVTEAHYGGFGVGWLGAADFVIYEGQAGVAVPRSDRALTLSLNNAREMEPGAKAQWKLSVKDWTGKPVDGEATLRVYDRSLEYYMGAARDWTGGLYPAKAYRMDVNESLFAPGINTIEPRESWAHKMMGLFSESRTQKQPPQLRIWRSGVYSLGRKFSEGGLEFSKIAAMDENAADSNIMMEKATGGRAPAAAPMKAKADKAEMAVAGSAAPAPEAAPQVKSRSDFSETALFAPQIPLRKGTGRVEFNMPERLTSWKIGGYALTRDVKTGMITAETVTRKDLMVRVDMPRFFREGDKGQITAIAHNETEKPLTATIYLTVSQNGADAGAKLAVQSGGREVTIKPHSMQAERWDIAAPRGVQAFSVKATVKAGSLEDAEEKELPILPSRQRLMASQLVALDGDASARLELKDLAENDPTREYESIHLQVDPQLALTVLNSLPQLVRYPYECTEQLLNRYLPLAIVNKMYEDYPAMKAAVAKIPARTTATPAWEKDNPLRMMALMETPWENEADGIKTGLPSTDMLNPAVVEKERKNALDKLAAYQNRDGGFPWFPGGQSDLYMTLYALEAFAEAQRYGVSIPKQQAQRALAYTLAEIPRRMKPDERNLSFILYAAYVVSGYPQSWPQGATARRFAKTWVDYADKYADAMTQIGKAYASYVYKRLGEDKKAENYLDRALDGLREDPVAGAYWTPEKISWLWYNDSVEKHAFIIRTLLAVRPGDAHISPLMKWLLLNRKGNVWKSTRATAGAVYCLMDFMKTRGSFDKGDTFSINWAGEKLSAQVEPFDWLDKPMRWSKYGADAAQERTSATVDKKGPGYAFASLSAIYSTDRPAKQSSEGLMNVSKKVFLRYKEGTDYRLKPLENGATVSVGDEIVVQLTVTSKSQFEYVHLKDPRPAGFEAETLTSGWQWDKLSRYEEPRDSLTNFFMNWLPHGEYVLSYTVRPTTPGTYRTGAAQLQSMYAPEIAANSDSMTFTVK